MAGASGVIAASDRSVGPVQPQWLCASASLLERGLAVSFDLLYYRRPARGFALRIEGQVVAYVNQCAHVPVQMQWQEDQFLDHDRRWIICAMHGATYDPRSGDCVAGPCAGARLRSVALEERDGQVYWYPSADIRPPVPPAMPTPATAAPSTPATST